MGVPLRRMALSLHEESGRGQISQSRGGMQLTLIHFYLSFCHISLVFVGVLSLSADHSVRRIGEVAVDSLVRCLTTVS